MEQTLKLYLISQSENNGYDTYDAAVVAAYSEEEARMSNPDVGGWEGNRFTAWCHSPEQVQVLYIGVAASYVEPGEVLSSFNAG